MAHEVTVADSAPSERLVVAVAGKTLIAGEALDQDREAEGATILADESLEADDNLASELQLLAERVPEVAAAISVEYKAEPAAPADVTPSLEVEVGPALDPADQVVAAAETSPSVTRREVGMDEDEDAAVVVDPVTPEGGITASVEDDE